MTARLPFNSQIVRIGSLVDMGARSGIATVSNVGKTENGEIEVTLSVGSPVRPFEWALIADRVD